MNATDIQKQLQILDAAIPPMERWRPILVTSVLHMHGAPKVLGLIRQHSSDYLVELKVPSAVMSVRRLLEGTREKMGFPPKIPSSPSQKNTPLKNRSGKGNSKDLELWWQKYCRPWLEKNGGYPRLEQFLDPFWDLRPYKNADAQPHLSEVTKCDNTCGDGVITVPRCSENNTVSKLKSAEVSPEGVPVRETLQSGGESSANSNPITRSLDLCAQLRDLPLDSDYPPRAFELKAEIYTLQQKLKPGEKAPFSERLEWKEEIQRTWETAGFVWVETYFDAFEAT